MGTFYINNEKVTGFRETVNPDTVKMTIDGIEYFTRLRFYHNFEVTFNYLNKTEMNNLKSLSEASFTFFPFYNTQSTLSYLCILDKNFNFESQFYLAGSYNSNEITLRIMEVDG